MNYTRRTLLKHSAISVPIAMSGGSGSTFARAMESNVLETNVDRQEVIAVAVDAAISAGASYADARLTKNETFFINRRSPNPTQSMALGVRALYKGYWGFSASPIWSVEEAARLGQDAVAQAKVNVLGRERATELAPIEISSGHWGTPVKDDPFNIDFDELNDFFGGLRIYAYGLKLLTAFNFFINFSRVYKTFGSSLGQSTDQVFYQSGGNISFKLSSDKELGREAEGVIDQVSIGGMGFEYFRDRPLREYLRRTHEEALHDLTLPINPIDPGRYLTLVDQSGMAQLLHQSIGKATEVDRVFGFEANAGGTSYITDPHTMLNTFKIGSSSVNIWCDRSGVGSVGRVGWDDEGVAPVRYDLVKDGVLVNLQTNREGATWIKDHYQNTEQPFRSFGAANSPSGMDVQLAHLSDLYLEPDDSALTRDDLRESMDEGIELRIPAVSLDFQQVTGWSRFGRAYEIKKGKRVAILANAGMLFRTPELWNNIIQSGGRESVEYFGLESKKGQPQQTVASGVYAPPCVVKDMTIIDITRKA